jgi:hypothetical protein
MHVLGIAVECAKISTTLQIEAHGKVPLHHEWSTYK